MFFPWCHALFGAVRQPPAVVFSFRYSQTLASIVAVNWSSIHPKIPLLKSSVLRRFPEEAIFVVKSDTLSECIVSHLLRGHPCWSGVRLHRRKGLYLLRYADFRCPNGKFAELNYVQQVHWTGLPDSFVCICQCLFIVNIGKSWILCIDSSTLNDKCEIAPRTRKWAMFSWPELLECWVLIRNISIWLPKQRC